MAHRVAPRAEAELDGIWYYLAKESGSIEIADRVVDSITERFFLLARYPHIGRRRDESQAIPARRETGFQSPNFSSRKATWSSVARST